MEKNGDILKKMLEKDAKKVASSLDFSQLENKSVLITGASGLIGLNFLSSLLEISKNISGITVYAVIHSDTSFFMETFLCAENVTVFQGDLLDEHFVGTLPKADIIIHAAGSGIPERFLKNKLASLEINTTVVIKLFEKLNADGKFLFISSSEVYSGLPDGKYSEDQIGMTNTNHPRACYIEGKKAGETICNIYREMGVKASSVRLSLTYGPGMLLSDSRVLPSFILKALEGKIDLLDSGQAFRTFCYISDAIEQMWFILLHGTQNLYNVGGVNHSTIGELAELIGKMVHVPVHFPAKISGIDGASPYVDVDLNRIINESKKTTFVSLEDGLMNTINWYKQLRGLF